MGALGPGHEASVVVINHNYAQFLRAAVESVLGQTDAAEVVIVDDGSTDASREIIDSYGSEVVPVLKENGGETSALNAGFKAATGNTIIFLDADDVLLPSAVSRAVDALRPADTSTACWQMRAIDKDGGLLGGLIPGGTLPSGALRDEVIRNGPAAVDFPPTSGNAYHRRFLAYVFPLPLPKPLREVCGDDAYLSTLAAVFGRLVAIDEPLSLHRLHGANIYSSKPFEFRLSHDKAVHERLCDGLEKICHQRGVAVDRNRWNRLSWICQLDALVALLLDQVPPDQPLVLIDDNLFGIDQLGGRPVRPLIAQEGVYWGSPDDDNHAIAALEAHRADGVTFLALVPHSYWWLDEYPDFFEHLRQTSHVLLDDEQLTVYRLRH